MKKKLFSQISIIAGIVSFFVITNVFIYFVFTNRCVNDFSSQMQAKSVEVDQYLPFASDTKIVKKEATKLDGNLPVIDGAAALVPVFNSFVYSIYPESSVKYENGDFTSDSKLQYHNTRGAYKSIVDGDIDIAFCAKPNDEQVQYGLDKGVELELTPIGREAFVFLVNKNNPVDNLSMQELKDILTGKITNWKDVGGASRPINVVQRNKGSGSQTALEKLVGEEKIASNFFGPLGGSLGFSFRFYVEELTKHGHIKMLKLNDVYPDKEHVQDNSYPIVSNFFAVTRKGESNPNVQKVLDFVLSPTGQAIIDEVGYVSL
jgi:phosphate transport system substrate-binding protein